MKQKKLLSYLKIENQSKQVTLRPYKLTDFAKCRTSHKNREPNKNRFDEAIPTPRTPTYDRYKKRIERHRQNGRLRVHFIFAVFDRTTGHYVGQIDLFTINKQLRWGNLGYCIQNQFWGMGYATEACRLGLGIAFKSLGFHRIEAATELDNRASINVAKKIGMTYEGKRQKFFPERGGIDMVVFGANAIDWE